MKLTFDYKIIFGLIVITFVNMVITCWPVAEIDDFERAYQQRIKHTMVQTAPPAVTTATVNTSSPSAMVTTPTLAALPLAVAQP